MSKNENGMKTRFLYLIPLLTLVFLVLSTTLFIPQTVYAAPATPPSTSQPDQLECPDGTLHWIVCPVIWGMQQVVDQLDSLINKQMSIGTPGDSSDPNQIFCNSHSTGNARISCDAYHTAWASVRDLALGLMVAAIIIVLIAQALGLEILDAYTIRKVLPRLLVCALAITLSWQLMQFFVTFSNDLAYGIRYLIYKPFVGVGAGAASNFGGGGSAVSGLLGVGALTALGWFGLISYLGTALLAVFIAVLVLVLRQLVVIMLIIIAPIAIAAYILPNTVKVYKFWWESFSKALLMFALISGLIATGRVFSVVASLNTDSTLGQLVALSAYFLPYFLIPATFKFAGGAISQIGGFVNSRSQGAFGALKGYRGNVAKKNWQDLKDGNRLHNENSRFLGYGAFARRFNAATRETANLKNAGYNPARMRARMSAARSTSMADAAVEALEKNKDVSAIKSDDDLVESALYASREEKEGRRGGDHAVREALRDRGYANVEQGVALVRAARNSMSTDTFDTSMAIASFGTSSGWTPKYHTDPVTGQRTLMKGSGGAGEARQMINQVVGDDRQRGIRVLGMARQMAESKGRYDLSGGSFTEDAEMLELAHDGKLTTEQLTERVHRGVLDGTGRGRIFGGHRRAIDALAPMVKVELDEAFMGGNGKVASGQAAFQQLAFAADTLDAAGSNSAESAREFNDKVLNQKVKLTSIDQSVVQAIKPEVLTSISKNGETTYGQIMEAVRTDPQFGRYRREYGSSSREAAASGALNPPGAPPTPPPAPGTPAGPAGPAGPTGP